MTRRVPGLVASEGARCRVGGLVVPIRGFDFVVFGCGCGVGLVVLTALLLLQVQGRLAGRPCCAVRFGLGAGWCTLGFWCGCRVGGLVDLTWWTGLGFCFSFLA
jgi:hypothetical protein